MTINRQLAPIQTMQTVRVNSWNKMTPTKQGFDPSRDLRLAHMDWTDAFSRPDLITLTDGTILLSCPLLTSLGIQPDLFDYAIGRSAFASLQENFDCLAFRHSQCQTYPWRSQRERWTAERNAAILEYIINLL